MSDDPTLPGAEVLLSATGYVPDKNEGLYARDYQGQLIRGEAASAEDFNTDVRLTIDGREIVVKKALPERDSQGNLRLKNDRPIPRATTIYDAVSLAIGSRVGQGNPIPTLCHREHLPPVGVCRVCLVGLVEGSRSRLVPACKYVVQEGMEVHTLDSQANGKLASKVRSTVKTIVELLATDHLTAEGVAFPENELAALAQRVGAQSGAFPTSRSDRGLDLSSPVIKVDHNQCIMCGRCVRGCNWVKQNDVIGRAGRGYSSHIAFDLDLPIVDSSCVSCGECAISCPTGALHFDPQWLSKRDQALLSQESSASAASGELLSPEALRRIPLFNGIPYKFLQFNGSCVVRRRLKKGDVLCREGEYGNTAFIIESGSFEITLNSTRGAATSTKAKGLWGLLGTLRTGLERIGSRNPVLSDLAGQQLREQGPILRTAEDVILGEMSCMNRYPRSATVVAAEESQVLEIRRNVLHMLQRSESSRRLLEDAYRKRAMVGQLERLQLLQALDSEDRALAAEYLKEKVRLLTVAPSQMIFEMGDPADDFYIVRLGFVKVSQQVGAAERVVNYLGPGKEFGEIGLLSELFNELTMGEGQLSGTRTASCSALDHVELIALKKSDFRELLDRYPQIRQALLSTAQNYLERDRRARDRLHETRMEALVEQGLHQAQKLLVIDLERCTRCDECTKACADTHQGVTRLIRDGLRFDRFLVASSCRSCLDPHCLIGCPVDAIHRSGESLEIKIEDYCIGCGLCAESCPYGNINMHGFPSADNRQLVQQKATTCDLCASLGTPSCVYACPHDAAFRMSGDELLEALGERVTPQ